MKLFTAEIERRIAYLEGRVTSLHGHLETPIARFGPEPMQALLLAVEADKRAITAYRSILQDKGYIHRVEIERIHDENLAEVAVEAAYRLKLLEMYEVPEKHLDRYAEKVAKLRRESPPGVGVIDLPLERLFPPSALARCFFAAAEALGYAPRDVFTLYLAVFDRHRYPKALDDVIGLETVGEAVKSGCGDLLFILLPGYFPKSGK